ACRSGSPNGERPCRTRGLTSQGIVGGRGAVANAKAARSAARRRSNGMAAVRLTCGRLERERRSDMGKYVDGFVLPVPKQNVEAYRRLAEEAGKVWREHGALEYVECVAEDVKPGEVTSFP